MSDAIDFKFVLACGIITILWGTFNILYLGGEIEDSKSNLPEYKEQSGIIAALSLATDFLNPFSENFKSEYFIVNLFVFSILGLGLLMVALRYIRG